MRGDITVDGHPKVHETFRRIASYVEQVSFPLVTALESWKPACLTVSRSPSMMLLL